MVEEILPSSPPFSYLSVVGWDRRLELAQKDSPSWLRFESSERRHCEVLLSDAAPLSPPDPGLLSIPVPQFRFQIGAASALGSFMLAPGSL